jgi:hypothetical protein
MIKIDLKRVFSWKLYDFIILLIQKSFCGHFRCRQFLQEIKRHILQYIKIICEATIHKHLNYYNKFFTFLKSFKIFFLKIIEESVIKSDFFNLRLFLKLRCLCHLCFLFMIMIMMHS